MQFRFTRDEDQFREEVRAFIQKELPADIAAGIGQEEAFRVDLGPRIKDLRRKLAERNWIAISWPKQPGGLGETLIKQAIFKEEMAYWRCPGIDPQAYQLGPAIIAHGTENQKRRYLGGIARAEVTWCQGFSEPNAGSDLAALETRAVREGDDWIINGQKIWTSGAHVADYIHLLARTDPKAPKHKGITYFLLPLRLPGIAIKPIGQVDGGEGFNAVFFDNVRIPGDSVFGEVNLGWYVATTTLNFERSNVANSAAARRYLDDLVAYLRSQRRRANNSYARRHRVIDLMIEVEVARALSYGVVSLQSSGKPFDSQASIAKLFSYELNARVAWLAMEVLGLPGQLPLGHPRAPLGGRVNWAYLRSACRVGGGSPEIQKNIIAQRGLGLPRGM